MRPFEFSAGVLCVFACACLASFKQHELLTALPGIMGGVFLFVAFAPWAEDQD